MLSVFAGSWDLDAAASLGRTLDLDEFDVIDHISELVTKSLVITEPGSDGSTWYRLLEPLRQYAEDALAKAERTEVIRTAHLEYYSKWAARWRDQLPIEGMSWKAAMLDRFPNLRAAVAWGVATNNAEQTADLISCLGLAQQAFLLFEIGDWAEQVLELPGLEHLPTGAVAAGTAAMTHWWRADIPEFIRLAQRSVDMPGRDPGDVLTSSVEGLLALVLGDQSGARGIIDRADRSNPVGDIFVSYMKLALAPEPIQAELDHLQHRLDETHSHWVEAILCLFTARAQLIEGRYDEAATSTRQGRVAASNIGATFYVHHCVFALTDSLAGTGQLSAEDAQTVADTLREQRDAGQELDQWLVLLGLDLLLFRLGHRDLAAAIRRGFRSTVWAGMHASRAYAEAPETDQLEEAATTAPDPANVQVSDLVDAVLDILDSTTDDAYPAPA